MTKALLGEGCPINVERLIESRMLIQANSGGGKSWAIRRLLEQTYGDVQQILIDVDGEFKKRQATKRRASTSTSASSRRRS